MAVRALLLDFGGTLASERASRASMYAAAGGRFGLAVGEERMGELMRAAHAALPVRVGGRFRYGERWFGAFIERIFVRELGLAPERLADLTAELLARFADPSSFRPTPGAEELLDAARRRGLRAAVVSNWSERLEPLLEGLGLRRRLDAVLASAIEEVEKPDPELFRRALARLGVEARAALHLGNHWVNDVAGARAAGITPIFYDPSGTMAPSRDGVTVVASLLAVIELLPTPERP